MIGCDSDIFQCDRSTQVNDAGLEHKELKYKERAAMHSFVDQGLSCGPNMMTCSNPAVFLITKA